MVGQTTPQSYHRNPRYGAVQVRHFGAFGDGVADDTVAIQTAIDNVAAGGGGSVYFPQGTYRLTAQISLADGVALVGDGEGVTRLSFAGAAISTACIYAQGSLTTLPDLDADVARGDFSFDFASAPTLSPGDLFVIWDPTDFSFNPARDHYRAGEWCRVLSVSSATVTLTRALHADYASATVENHALTPVSVGIHDMSIDGLGTTSTVAVVRVTLGANCSFSGLRLTGSQFAHILLDRVVGATISRVVATDFGAVGNTNYGIAIDSCSDVVVTSCTMHVRRHGITLADWDDTAGVPTRNVVVSDCILTGTNAPGLDAHGSAEQYTFAHCRCYGGISAGGDRAKVVGCSAWGSSVTVGRALVFSETIGCDFTVADCDLYEAYPLDALRGLLDWGGNDTSAQVLADRAGGRFIINGNRFHLDAGLNAMIMRHRGTDTDDANVEVIGNTVFRPTTGSAAAYMAVRGDSTHHFRQVLFADNNLDGVGIIVENTGAELVQIRGGQIRNAGAQGVRVSDDGTPANFPWGGADGDQSILVDGVQIVGCMSTGIRLEGWDDEISQCKVVNCTSINNAQDSAESSSLLSSLYVADFEAAYVHGNTLGDDQGTPTQSRTWAADLIGLLVEANNILVGHATFSVNLTNIGRKVSSVYQLGSGANEYNVEGFGVAAPATGTWVVGDRIWNSTPAVGQPIGWMCTVGGTPGTWVALVNL